MRFLAVLFVLLAWPADAHAFIVAALPVAAAIGAGTATTAVSALTIAQIGLGVLGAAGSLFQGLSARQNAEAQAQQAELNARLEGTAALQRDTIRREELERTVGTIRAARGDRGVNSPTALSFLNEADENISSDRTVELLNSRQRQADLGNQAQRYRTSGRLALISGGVQAGTSLFQTAAYARRFS